jgi:dihydrodipicolinate synthase/N-acetylneuraminate lyase
MWTEKLEPQNYTDEDRHHMLEVVAQMVNGKDIVVAHEGCKEATKTAARKARAKKSPANNMRGSHWVI